MAWFPTVSENDYIYLGERVPVRGDLVSHYSTYEKLLPCPGDKLFVVTVDRLPEYQQRPWHIWRRVHASRMRP